MIGIYCIENIKHGKKYIGQSIDISRRLTAHKSYLKYNRHRNSHLQDSWNKNGSDNFKFYTIEECAKEDLTSREKHWMDFYDSFNNGYNMKTAEERPSFSIQVKNKMSASQKARPPRTLETRARMSSSMKGRKFSDQHKQHLSDTHADFNGINSGKLGMKLSNASSIYHGVHYHRTTDRWESSFSIHGKVVYLGRFKLEIDASLAYDKYITDNNLPNPLNHKKGGKYGKYNRFSSI